MEAVQTEVHHLHFVAPLSKEFKSFAVIHETLSE